MTTDLMEETGIVLRKETFLLEPIREKVSKLEQSRSISKLCRGLGMSRNHLYLILNGRSATTEDTLKRLLEALGLQWESIQAKKV